ncbi:uncharacterized protein BJ212DRAFT_1282876 [Suillus subaureus]|uniref:Uncharacterized protein n=1 Tax=Suillus subaureus TaxID=48587 RepID=A0A9P7J738_9AGAM|nr:uncharacterized protein BJ212DRAFT_1282876 [Suillus subaureus]KAG1806068.1 hypothetical protein BJ212DRAFT_1282876 [Suillus subaureus]
MSRRSSSGSLINHLDCPELPYFEWDDIIAGQPVNLDIVLSDIYAGSGSATVATALDWPCVSISLRVPSSNT